MYTQNNEESFILDYFKDQPTGKFVDIGAYDTFRFSNIRALYEKGWGGVLVEPAPENFRGLQDHYKGVSRIHILNIAVGEPEGEIEFYSCQDAVSTSDKAHRDKWAAAGVKFETIKVRQMDVALFMHLYCMDCDFLSVDTEATNLVLFRAIPDWVFGQIKMLCIEHDGGQKEIEDRLRPFGFNTLYFNAENIILAK